MRSDFYHVLLERPRWNGSALHEGRAREHHRRDPEHAPTWQPVGRGRGTKGLNENLAPLRRFLERCTGRAWNDVYSEICKQVTLDNAVQRHVLEHLENFVETNVVLIDGVPHGAIAHGGKPRARLARGGRGRNTFYVCPATRRLLVVPRIERPVKARSAVHALGPASELRRLDGVWYVITFADCPARDDQHGRRYDTVLRLAYDPRARAAWCTALSRFYGRNDRYAVEKRQAGSRLLRKHGLTGNAA